MTAVVLCILAFAATFWVGKRSLGLGVVALLLFGYFYGIIRANIPATFSHFLFDSSLLGLYLSQKWSAPANSEALRSLKGWILVLFLWPCVMVLLPTQPLLVSLVGLRGSVFFLPMAWLGAKLKSRDVHVIALGFAVLNLAALGFAVAEYFRGVPAFYPMNAVTIVIYASTDVAGGFYRIPATFANAHNFGGAMVASIPYLLGAWEQSQKRILRILFILGTAAALLGILMSATRLNFVLGGALVVLALWRGRMRTSRRALFAVLIVGMVFVALRNERFQRFKSLSDSDSVQERISGSVNRTIFEILLEYPMGNGLGGGGTSIPYFLQGQVRNPIGTENEYLRILCEQGLIGLLFWIGFILWFLLQYRSAFAPGPWSSARRMIWFVSVITLSTAFIGNGMLTAVPSAALLLLGIGFSSSPKLREGAVRRVALRPVITGHRYRTAPGVGF
jgi:O-Antigen ligase